MAHRWRLAAITLVLGVACADPVGPPLTFLAVNPPSALIVVGDTVRLTATGLSFSGDTIRGLPITWSSSDTAVATVSSAGVVTGRGLGSATITAASGAIHGPAGLTVTIHFASVAQGGLHYCALTSGGAAYCWGVNWSGQLGDGSTTDRVTPTAVLGGHRFRSLVTGAEFTCGIDTDSLAWCWGYGGYLGIGAGDTVRHPVPVAVSGGHHFRELSATWSHACGVTTRGAGLCWGWNDFGVLGTGAAQRSWVGIPSTVTGGLAFGSIQTAEYHSCGITVTGAAHCWGSNYSWELGAVTDTLFLAPVAVGDTLSLAGLEAGGDQACALAAGTAVCWGSMEIGEGYWHRRSPTLVAPGLSFARIFAEYSTTCGLDFGGTAWCWGSNWFGEVGDGSRYQPRYPPVPVTGGHAFEDISVGDVHVCAVEQTGTAYCWGDNSTGELGKGTFGGQDSVPVAVVGGHAFRSIAAGSIHSCGIATDSTAWCWGSNGDGELGDSSTTSRSQPTLVRGGLKWIDLAPAGYTYYAYTCGITSTGAAYCWGNGSKGQLGTGSNTSSTVPVPVAGGLTFTQVAAGGPFAFFTCGLAAGGTAYCWGANRFGNLGRGDTVSSSSPVPVTGGLSFSSVTAGNSFACGRTLAGVVYCWGSNSRGQMGQGSLGIESLRPIPVQTALTFKHVAAGASHSCGLAADSTAWCWGLNWEGQLGTGDSLSSIPPRAVAGGQHFAALTLGNVTSCGLTAAGVAYCWGGGRSDVPAVEQPGTVFLTLTSGLGDRVCGVRADSTVTCRYVSPYAASAHRPLPFPPGPVPPRRRVRGSP